MKTTIRHRGAALAVGGLMVVLAGCAGTTPTATSGEDGAKNVVFFSLPASHPYVAELIRQAEESADERGWDLEVIQANFDSAEQDQQVQQYLASGERPDAFLWYPNDAKAGINSTRQLSAIAPVFQVNQAVQEGGEDYVEAYVGVNSFLNGQVSGAELIRARDEDRSSGVDLGSEGGNVLVFSYPVALRESQVRTEGFEDATSSDPFEVLETVDGGFSTETGYTAAATVIPKYLEQGIDYIWAFGGNLATGVAQAARENGLEPGVDVKIVAGNCTGDLSSLEDGSVYSEGVQSPSLEMQLTFDVLERFFETGEIDTGTYQGEDSADFPDLSGTSPNIANYMPNPPVTKDTLADPLWGGTRGGLCTF